MKTKYYRFLYFGRKSCLLHVGEIEDTRREERLTFLYVGSYGQDDVGEHDENGLSYPKRVDVLIVGDASKNTEEIVEEILAETVVDTMVFPYGGGLRRVFERYKIKRMIELRGKGTPTEYRICQAGWIVRMACLTEGTVVLLHGLEQQKIFDDCVMNVSVLDGEEHLGWWNEKDGFAAAMRCTVRHDYDACRYRADGKDGKYRISTLLYGATPLNICRGWMQSLGNGDSRPDSGLNHEIGDSRSDGCLNPKESELNEGLCLKTGEFSYDAGLNPASGLRFLSLPPVGLDEIWDESILEEIPSGYKCYYVGSPGEPSGRAINQVCRRGPYQIPVITGEGTGVCCAGFLKYSE